MRGEVQMTIPEVALVLGIRAAIGVGSGLLLANLFSSARHRKAVGGTLLLAGTYAGACVMTGIFSHGRPFTMKFGQRDHTLTRPHPPRKYWPEEAELGEVPVE